MQVSSLVPLTPTTKTLSEALTSNLSRTSLTPSHKSLGEQSFSALPDLPKTSKTPKPNLPPMRSPTMRKQSVEEVLMKAGNKVSQVEVKNPELEFLERDKALPIASAMSKVKPSESTVTFETFEGIPQNQDVEKALLERGFIPTEKILTRDDVGNVVCRFIKVRDKLGHAAYVELDCDYHDGMGFLTISSDDTIMTQSHEASVIPYSLKIGSFEANNNDLYGVGFECDNSVCVMSRKDSSLDPVESVFTYANGDESMGILNRHPIPFPIIKITDILANPDIVHKNIKTGHTRMRNVAFTSCMKEVESMKKYANELNEEIQRFDKISTEVSNVLTCTINDLENMHDAYEKQGAKCQKDVDNVKSIRFNLNKRHDLVNDHIANCNSMRERAEKVRVLAEELKSLNDFSQTLFTGLSSVFTE
jgi:hypothetical protein